MMMAKSAEYVGTELKKGREHNFINNHFNVFFSFLNKKGTNLAKQKF